MRHVLFLFAGAYVDLATMLSLDAVIEWASTPTGKPLESVIDWIPLAYATAGVAIGTTLIAFGTIHLAWKPMMWLKKKREHKESATT